MLKARKAVQQLSDFVSPVLPGAGLRLDLNENTGGCSPRVLEKLRELRAEDVWRYPDRSVGERLVAKWLGLHPEQVLLCNGVDEGLHLLCETFLEPEDEVLFSVPTFTMYPIYAAATGAAVVTVPAKSTFAYPTEELIERINPRTRLIAIANPNNPTGTTVPRADLLRIIAAAPDAAVVVDEAYFEFYGETLLDRLPTYENLVVARTFSKAYGLAGMRLGVLAGNAAQIEMVRRVSSPFNLNGPALACLPVALEDQDFVRNYVTQVREGREQVRAFLLERGFRCWPSQANFVLAELGAARVRCLEELARTGVLVRDRDRDPGCAGCVRITIGTREQTQRLLSALGAALCTTPGS